MPVATPVSRSHTNGTPGSTLATGLSGGTAAVGTMMPLATNALLDLATEGAAEYMRRQVERLRTGGLEATAEVRRGETAANLVEAAERAGTDVIAMASHGRSGLGRWALGSVADKVLNCSDVPILLIRISKA